jgi:hypothetical protein
MSAQIPGVRRITANPARRGEALERTRTENRKREERRKQGIVTRARILDAILEKIATPLAKADLELIVREFLNRVPQEYRTVLAQRHSAAPAKGKTPKQPVEIGSALKNLDESWIQPVADRNVAAGCDLQLLLTRWSRTAQWSSETISRKYPEDRGFGCRGVCGAP